MDKLTGEPGRVIRYDPSGKWIDADSQLLEMACERLARPLYVPRPPERTWLFHFYAHIKDILHANW